MNKIIKEIRLICCEVGNNANKFWTGQLFDNNDVKTIWGRIGLGEQSKLFPNAGESFLLKKEAQKLKGKAGESVYTHVKTIAETGTTINNVAQSDLLTIAKSQIKTNSPTLDLLVERLVKKNIHKITSSTNISFNSSSGLFTTPLGIVTLEGITEARNILADVIELVKKGDYGSKMVKSVNSFLRIIPQNIGSRKLDLKTFLPDVVAVQKQASIIDSLESSYQAIQKAPEIKDSGQVLEEIFKVKLGLLESEVEKKRISDWFYKSNHSVHGYSNVKIINFYCIEIEENLKGFNEKLGNIVEVFHSTGESNLLSILKTGLKMSPPSTVRISGAMFSCGHYGALDSSKSLQYTMGRFGSDKGESGWSFVADFAMGKQYDIKTYGGSRPSGYDSIFAKKELTGLRFDELIVPTDAQVKLKYLLEVK